MNFLNVNLDSLNLFSFMLGMFFAATMYRARAMVWVTLYAFALAAYFWFYSQQFK
jgi:hypothetical protein